MTWSAIKFNIKYRVPMAACLVSMVITTARLYAGELIALESVPFVIAFIFTASVGIYLGFVSVSMAATGKREHVREVIRERERFVEPEYEPEVEVESWQHNESEFESASQRIVTQLPPAQALAHMKVNPPQTLAECDRMIEKYKKFKTIKLHLLNVRKSIQAKSNETQRLKGDSMGDRTPSPQFDFGLQNGAYVART
jgi:hypothetical protein